MLVNNLVFVLPSVILFPNLESSNIYELPTENIQKQSSTLDFNYIKSEKLIEENIKKYQDIKL
jgi:hypothetical protein